MKKIVFIVLGLLGLHVLLEALLAADITSGEIFTPGQANITHVEMNKIAGAAVINTTFITDKSDSVPVAADVFLYYQISGAGYRKATLSEMVFANTLLITSQSEDSSPAFNDYVLTYDTSAGSYKKVAIQNLPLGITNLISGFPTITFPLLADFIPLSENSTNAKVTVGNFLAMSRTNFDYVQPFTNLATITSPLITDQVLVYGATGQTNGRSVIGTVRTNLFFKTYTSSNYAFSVGVKLNNVHNLGGIPQMVRVVLVCTNTLDGTTGYVAGDEVDVANVDEGSAGSGSPNFSWGANTTNIFVLCNNATAATTFMATKTNAARTSISAAANWNIKAYATFFTP